MTSRSLPRSSVICTSQTSSQFSQCYTLTKLALSGGQLCTRGSPARGRRWPSAGPRRPVQCPLGIMLQPPEEVNMTHNAVTVRVALRIARPRPSQAVVSVPRRRSRIAARLARCEWRPGLGRRGSGLNCAAMHNGDGRSRCHLRGARNRRDDAGDVRRARRSSAPVS